MNLLYIYVILKESANYGRQETLLYIQKQVNHDVLILLRSSCFKKLTEEQPVLIDLSFFSSSLNIIYTGFFLFFLRFPFLYIFSFRYLSSAAMLINKSIAIFITAAFAHVNAATIRKRALAPQFSPTFPNLAKPSGVVTSYNPGPYDTESSLATAPLFGFPEPWSKPDTNSAEVQAAFNAIDWTKVPNAPVRARYSDGSWVSNSDGPDDPYCWWSSTNCLTPKSPDLPPDLYTCPRQGDWGLNYDDGPFNRYTDANAALENKYAEPALYNFLAEQGLHASLFVSYVHTYHKEFVYSPIHQWLVYWLQCRVLSCCSSARPERWPSSLRTYLVSSSAHYTDQCRNRC
jgi:hypothetical protein